MLSKVRKEKFKGKIKQNVIAIAITSLLIVILLLSSPAQAFTLNLSVEDSEVQTGEDLVFTAKIDSNSNSPIDNISLILDGPSNLECVFDVNGNALSGDCDRIEIEKTLHLSLYGYSYGYGYGYGYGGENLEYEINIPSDKLSIGVYTTTLNVKSGKDEFLQGGDDITINGEVSSGEGGSGCLTEWRCSEWGSCINSKQTRTCVKEKDYCYAGTKPTEEQSCSSNGNANENTQTNTLVQENQNNSRGGITGAIIGTNNLGTSIILIVAGVIVIVLISYFISRARKRRLRKKFFEEKKELSFYP
jgi:hypothetical protein